MQRHYETCMCVNYTTRNVAQVKLLVGENLLNWMGQGVWGGEGLSDSKGQYI